MDKNNIFESALKHKKCTWWIMELPSGKVIFGKAKADMLGFPASKFKTYQDFTKLLHKDYYQTAMDAMTKAINGPDGIYETIYKIKTKDGKYITFYDFGLVTSKSEEGITTMGFIFKVPESTKSIEDVPNYKSFIKTASIPELIEKIK
jgi:two-component system CheB/CheR fusion protein